MPPLPAAGHAPQDGDAGPATSRQTRLSHTAHTRRPHRPVTPTPSAGQTRRPGLSHAIRWDRPQIRSQKTAWTPAGTHNCRSGPVPEDVIPCDAVADTQQPEPQGHGPGTGRRPVTGPRATKQDQPQARSAGGKGSETPGPWARARTLLSSQASLLAVAGVTSSALFVREEALRQALPPALAERQLSPATRASAAPETAAARSQ
jgi:hypothetical protein